MTGPWDLTEAQRRQFREAHAEAKRTRPPSKPWRVTWPSLVNLGPNSEDYRSKRAAYEAVESITRVVTATVYHWVSGTWVLYEIAEPVSRGDHQWNGEQARFDAAGYAEQNQEG